ncbi:serine/threonine protein kinase [Candidatus Uabimicrobium sp. HlEnr_7]|uniref:serine/threonine protein kinase n=1 Tax=Candidatus Uabimicrobium helgolandensis TaxID=3095367 RepID=UPI0035567838
MSILDDITKKIERLPGIQGFIFYWKGKIVNSRLPKEISDDSLESIIEILTNVYGILDDNGYDIDDLFIGYKTLNTIVQPFKQGKLVFFADEKINYKVFTMSAKPIFKSLESTDTLAIYNQTQKKKVEPEKAAVDYVPENILDSIQSKMANIIGPMAKILFNKNRKFPSGEFPRTELRVFIQKLADYIPDEKRREMFFKEIVQYSLQITSMKSTERLVAPEVSETIVSMKSSDSLVGSSLGGCILQEMIGSGGIGKVYKGKHSTLGLDVAVKILSPNFYSSEEAIQRFSQEGKILAQIDHPNVAKVINLGFECNFHFLVMKFIEGQDLFSVLQNCGYLPLEQAVDYGIQIARGLESIHGQNIIHRDIKPANVIIEENKIIKIVDFGSVRILDSSAEMTTEGTILGTPLYMSPEQCLGEELTPASDIYSLGATLYHLLTGTPPFEEKTSMETIWAHVKQDVIPPVQKISLPHKLSDIIVKTMNKKVNERYQSASELVHDLEKIALNK